MPFPATAKGFKEFANAISSGPKLRPSEDVIHAPWPAPRTPTRKVRGDHKVDLRQYQYRRGDGIDVWSSSKFRGKEDARYLDRDRQLSPHAKRGFTNPAKIRYQSMPDALGESESNLKNFGSYEWDRSRQHDDVAIRKARGAAPDATPLTGQWREGFLGKGYRKVTRRSEPKMPQYAKGPKHPPTRAAPAKIGKVTRAPSATATQRLQGLFGAAMMGGIGGYTMGDQDFSSFAGGAIVGTGIGAFARPMARSALSSAIKQTHKQAKSISTNSPEAAQEMTNAARRMAQVRRSMNTPEGRYAMHAGGSLLAGGAFGSMFMSGNRKNHRRGFNQNRGNTF